VDAATIPVAAETWENAATTAKLISSFLGSMTSELADICAKLLDGGCLHIRLTDMQGNTVWDDICLGEILCSAYRIIEVGRCALSQLATGETRPEPWAESPQRGLHNTLFRRPVGIHLARVRLANADQVDLIRYSTPGVLSTFIDRQGRPE
jgi:hypothetical protein